MKPVLALAAAFAAGAAVASSAALVLTWSAASRAAQEQAQKDMQVAVMVRVAENALRNPALLATGAPGSPLAAAAVTLPAAPASAPAPVPAGVASQGSNASTSNASTSNAAAAKHAPSSKPSAPAQARPRVTAPEPHAAVLAEPQAHSDEQRLAAAAPRGNVEPNPQPAPTRALPDLARVLATVPVEGVSYEKASVSRVEAGAVVLRDGRRVAIGQPFPSGDLLLAVDAPNSRLVTDRRQILLFGPAGQGK